MAKKMYMKEEILEEVRGTIYDRAGRELAVSIEVDSLYADPAEITSKVDTARRLSTILNINEKKLLSKLKNPSRFVWVKRKISQRERDQIQVLGIKGLSFIKEYKRVYPKGRLAAHLLGFVGLDNCGLEGIESYFDEYLRGMIRRIVVVKDARGQVIRVLPIKESFPSIKKGCDFVLTIDEVVQHIAEKELERAVTEYEAKGGSIIVMDCGSGEILAMAVEPSFDPNRFWKFKDADWRNRAVTDTFEPGSVLKPITFAAAIKERVIDLKGVASCPGYIEVSNRRIHCTKKHGNLTFGKALEESCNVGTIEAALRLNPKRFYEYMRSFGLGNITGIALPGEAKGLLRKPSIWSGLSQGSLAIGQEILVTPLQLITAISALANGGYLMEPLIVKEIRDQGGKVIKKFKPTCIRKTLSSQIIEKLDSSLEGVVLRCTGQNAQIKGYKVCGKTGTAQKFDKSIGRYSRTKSVASFAGWVKSGEKKISILVVIDEPRKGRWGGTVAAPAFSRVAQRILPYLGLFPEKPLFLTKIEDPPKRVVGLGRPSGALQGLPDLRGMSMRSVHQVLSSCGVKGIFEGSGVAVRQLPSPGAELSPGMEVRIQFKGG